MLRHTSGSSKERQAAPAAQLEPCPLCTASASGELAKCVHCSRSRAPRTGVRAGACSPHRNGHAEQISPSMPPQGSGWHYLGQFPHNHAPASRSSSSHARIAAVRRRGPFWRVWPRLVRPCQALPALLSSHSTVALACKMQGAKTDTGASWRAQDCISPPHLPLSVRKLHPALRQVRARIPPALHLSAHTCYSFPPPRSWFAAFTSPHCRLRRCPPPRRPRWQWLPGQQRSHPRRLLRHLVWAAWALSSVCVLLGCSLPP